ncbi:unnamed protein product [Choristocarpus tenellus]
MNSPRLVHLFTAPLVRGDCQEGDDGHQSSTTTLVPVEELDYEMERAAIVKALDSGHRRILYKSEVGKISKFLLCLTGCRVMHLTWNGSKEQRQVPCEDDEGCFSPISEEDFLASCTGKVPEVVVLSGRSAKAVARTFILAGIKHVVAVERSAAMEELTLGFTKTFYEELLQGFTLQDSFDQALRRLACGAGAPFALLPEKGDHSVTLFDGIDAGQYIDETPSLPINRCDPVSSNFLGQEVQVHETFKLMRRKTQVICVKGPSGIGKTEVALRACAYARERHTFGDIFFVPLGERKGMPAAVSTVEVVGCIAEAFGFEPQVMEWNDPPLMHQSRFSSPAFYLPVVSCVLFLLLLLTLLFLYLCERSVLRGMAGPSSPDSLSVG